MASKLQDLINRLCPNGVEFEMELVRQVDVNIDYILMLVQRYHDENALNKELKAAIDKAIGSSGMIVKRAPMG